jgi:AraC-like DNA-binding protein
MGRAAGRDAAPLGRLTCLARQEQFERRSTGGGRVRKVNVTISPEWLEDGGLGADCGSALLDFTQSHLSVARWRPSARIVALAEQILRPPPYAAVLRSLYLESRAIEIVQEALQAVAHAGMTPAAALRPGEDRRIRAVRDFLEENLTAVLSLEEIAREVGLGVSTLQRQFRAVYGTSVFDYLRHRRLELARDALERDGVSVAQAAYIAGYSSPANFATAFRRSFGVPPKHLRARL